MSDKPLSYHFPELQECLFAIPLPGQLDAVLAEVGMVNSRGEDEWYWVAKRQDEYYFVNGLKTKNGKWAVEYRETGDPLTAAQLSLVCQDWESQLDKVNIYEALLAQLREYESTLPEL